MRVLIDFVSFPQSRAELGFFFKCFFALKNFWPVGVGSTFLGTGLVNLAVIVFIEKAVFSKAGFGNELPAVFFEHKFFFKFGDGEFEFLRHFYHFLLGDIDVAFVSAAIAGALALKVFENLFFKVFIHFLGFQRMRRGIFSSV